MGLPPSHPKKAEVRQRIAAESYSHRPVAVAEESQRRENIKPGANEQGIKGHKSQDAL